LVRRNGEDAGAWAELGQRFEKEGSQILRREVGVFATD
jgi:hypothetical protein